jgi:hypothetical protein
MAPLIPVIVMDPVVAEVDAETVSVLVTAAEVLAVTDAGLNEQVRPPVPAHDRFTVPVNPCSEVMLRVSVVDPPVLTVSVAFPAPIWKSGTTTPRLIVTESVLLPLLP